MRIIFLRYYKTLRVVWDFGVDSCEVQAGQLELALRERNEANQRLQDGTVPGSWRGFRGFMI